MSRVRLILAFLLLVVLGGGYYYFDVVKAKQTEEREEESKTVLKIDPDKVTKLSVKKPDAVEVTVEKVDGAWKITAPVVTKADEGVVSQLLMSAKKLKSERGLGDDIAFNEIGLDTPIVLTFVSGDKTSQTLRLGGTNPSGGQVYVVGPDGKNVSLVTAGFEVENLKKGLYDLRDKKLFHMETKGVTDVRITENDTGIAVEKTKDEKSGVESWKVTAPIASDADPDTINKLLDKLTGAKATGFVEDSAADLAKYGLDKPAVTVKLSGDGGKKSETLFIGSESNESEYYARNMDSMTVFNVKKEVVDMIPEDAAALADHRIVREKLDGAKLIAVKTASGEYTIEAVSSKKKDDTQPSTTQWNIVAPVKTKADVPSVEGLLRDIGNLRADKIVVNGDYDPKQFGLDKAELVISVTTDKGKTTLYVSKTDKYYAAVEGVKAVYKISEVSFKTLDKNRDSMSYKNIVDFTPGEVTKVLVKRLDQTFDLKKDKNEYTLSGSVNKPIDEDSWNRLVWAVNGLKFVSALDATVARTAGFDKPSLSITVSTYKGTVAELLAGKKVEGTQYYYLKDVKADKVYTIAERFVTEQIVNILEGIVSAGQ